MSSRSTSGCRDHLPNVRRPTGRRADAPPALDGDAGSFGVDLALGGTHKISKHLPPDRWVTLQEPSQYCTAVPVGPRCPCAAVRAVHTVSWRVARGRATDEGTMHTAQPASAVVQGVRSPSPGDLGGKAAVVA
jgi:hypothetical protein